MEYRLTDDRGVVVAGGLELSEHREAAIDDQRAAIGSAVIDKFGRLVYVVWLGAHSS